MGTGISHAVQKASASFEVLESEAASLWPLETQPHQSLLRKVSPTVTVTQ